MLEFENVVYLDVQKTGSCFIRDFLRANVGAPEIRYKQHMPMKDGREDALYIISCRDPLRQYLSLYSFGCTRRGSFYNAMGRAGKEDIYDRSTRGFLSWLELLLDPEQVLKYVERRDKQPILKTVGLQTLRFLTLAFPRSRSVLQRVAEGGDLMSLYRRRALPEVCIRTESMKGDLMGLVLGAHKGKFLGEKTASLFLKYHRATNRSKKIPLQASDLGQDTLWKLQRREQFFFDVLGYTPYL